MLIREHKPIQRAACLQLLQQFSLLVGQRGGRRVAVEGDACSVQFHSAFPGSIIVSKKVPNRAVSIQNQPRHRLPRCVAHRSPSLSLVRSFYNDYREMQELYLNLSLLQGCYKLLPHKHLRQPGPAALALTAYAARVCGKFTQNLRR